jgi:isoquinoline 1-oxidoreductase alpha subunit
MARLRVNGELREVDVEESTPLLWVLREWLGLKGAKYACGMGLCGACTVHVDGQAIRSCVTPVSDVENKSVLTIEGLDPNGEHPLQQAWAELNVPQCGFCQTGQIMNAAALLQENPRPTEEEIEARMSGNLCRCGTYQRIKSAIQAASRAAGEVSS